MQQLLREQHKEFIDQFYQASKLSDALMEGGVKEHLDPLKVSEAVHDVLLWSHQKMSALYWASLSLYMVGNGDLFPKEEVLRFIQSCSHGNGGFSSNTGGDPHLLSTLSAIQLLLLYESTDLIEVDRTAEYVKSLQLKDGSFQGDEWGEIDTRFSYAALSCLSLIGRLNVIDVNKAVEYIQSCKNFDGGYGLCPGTESHAGQVFCCIGALKIAGCSHLADDEALGFWLAERQLPCGGLNGRPDKLEDVCYSWWTLASLSMMNKMDWVSKDALVEFILKCQDKVHGGFADRMDDMPDIFHTLFALTGLSLLKHSDMNTSIDPIYCMPKPIMDQVRHRQR